MPPYSPQLNGGFNYMPAPKDSTKYKEWKRKIGFYKGHPFYKGGKKGWFKKKHIPWNKGRKLPQLSGKNHPMYGKPSPNRGISMSEEQKEKIRQSNLKRWDIIGRKKYKRLKHDRWEYKNWKLEVFTRDNFTCQKCKHRNKKGCRKELVAHHKQNFAHYPKLRFLIENGITFCAECHKEFHQKYGYRNNTKEQLEEFLLSESGG